MEGGNQGDKIEAVIGKWIRHHISLDKLDRTFRTAAYPCPGDGIVIHVDGNHLPAMLGQTSRKQALATSHVERALTARPGQSQHKIVIVNIVIPLT